MGLVAPIMLTNLLLLPFLLLLTACGSSGKRTPPAVPRSASQLLAEKADLYARLLPARLGPSGFLYTEQCDSALFSGLLQAAAPELGTDIRSARDESGQWHRRPVSMTECYQAGLSKSSISRDMFTGILWALFASGDLESARSTLQYARDNNYIMGSGDPARIALMPNLTRVLANIVHNLGGDSSAEQSLPTSYPVDLVDYEAHIQMWQILLDARIHGGVTAEQMDVIRDKYTRYPMNPIYVAAYHKYTDGDQTEATQLLLNEAMYPADRLPDHTNSCDYWPLSRDPAHPDAGWGPCDRLPEGRAEANGAELVVIYRLIIQ